MLHHQKKTRLKILEKTRKSAFYCAVDGFLSTILWYIVDEMVDDYGN